MMFIEHRINFMNSVSSGTGVRQYQIWECDGCGHKEEED